MTLSKDFVVQIPITKAINKNHFRKRLVNEFNKKKRKWPYGARVTRFEYFSNEWHDKK